MDMDGPMMFLAILTLAVVLHSGLQDIARAIREERKLTIKRTTEREDDGAST